MNPAEWARVVARVNRIWPHRAYGPEWVQETFPLVEALAAEPVMRAVDAAATGGDAFPPTLGELLALAGLGPPDAYATLSAIAGGRGEGVPGELRERLAAAGMTAYDLRVADGDRIMRLIPAARRVIAEWHAEGGVRELARRRRALDPGRTAAGELTEGGTA